MNTGQWQPKGETEAKGFASGLTGDALRARQLAQQEVENGIAAIIRDRFSYHPPKPDQVQRYTTLRDDFIALAIRIVRFTPVGPQQDAAVEQLHIAMMLANRAIALE